MSIRLINLLFVLLLAGCSGDFTPLQAGTALNETGPAEAKPPTKVLVVGDANSPKLADFLTGKQLDVLDVPYNHYAVSDDLKMAGDYIVWSDNRNDPGGDNLDIYAYQISTGKEFVVTKAAGKQWLPAIAGDYIVWEDYRDGNADIYGYQISTATVFPIATEAQNQLYPQTDGENVVWQDRRDGNDDVYRFTLAGAGGTACKVVAAAVGIGDCAGAVAEAGDQKYPRVSGDYIVWQNYANGYNDIYLYKISTGAVQNLTSDKPDSSQYQPQLNGDYVVWLDNSNGANGVDIYAYQLPAGPTIPVAVTAGQQLNPQLSQLSKSRVVWQDNRDGNFDIYAYDLSSGTEARLSADPTDQTLPQISGDLVTWQDLRNDDGHGTHHYDIYAYLLTSPGERRITSDVTDQTHPQVSNGRIAWLDNRRGVTDLYWSDDTGSSLGLATNTWLTPAGMIGDVSKYDVVVLANDFVSNAAMLSLYDSALAAGIGVVGLGGTGKSLASALNGADRYGISVIPGSGCAPMRLSATPKNLDIHPLFYSINVDSLVTLETAEAVAMDELVIKTDPAKLSSRPATWIIQGTLSGDACSPGESTLVEFTDGKSKVVLDGSATMADGYHYWSGDRWDLFYNEVNYVKPK